MSVSVTVRLPDILAAKLVSRCLIRKARKTDVLIEAIGRGWDDAPAISGGETFGLSVNTDAGPIPDCTLKSAIADMQCRDNDLELVVQASPMCCECDHQLTGKIIKGRGIVWGCTYPGCAMFGREQRLQG